MKKIRVLVIFLAIIILSSCSANDPKFIVSKWGRSSLEWAIDQTYTTDYSVGYTVGVAESEDGEYEELFTFHKVDNKLLNMSFKKSGTEKYPQIKCANFAVSNDYIVVFKNQAIVGVSPSNNYIITHVYSTEVEDFMKLFDFKIDYFEFEMFSNYHGYKLYAVNKTETMPINPLKNIVLDYSDVTYDGKDFSIAHTDGGLVLMTKVLCEGKELLIKMEITYYKRNERYTDIISYLDSQDSFQTFTEWPDNYLNILNEKLRNQSIPVPDEISMYNIMIGLRKEVCELRVFMSDDDFIDNYATKLKSNGFYLGSPGKGNYFKKVTSGEQEFYIHIYMQKNEDNYIIVFMIDDSDSRVYAKWVD